MMRVVTRVGILLGMLVLGMLAGVAASSYDFSGTEKAVMAAVLIATAAAGVALQVSARRRAER